MMTDETKPVRACSASPAEAHDGERVAFEAKFGKHHKWCDPEVVAQLDQPLGETLVGRYIFNDIQKAWEAWQASAARFNVQPKGMQEPDAWQERQEIRPGVFGEWYDRRIPWGLNRPQEMDSGGIRYQFRPLYAAPVQAPAPGAEPACTRSHPHEDMSPACEALTEKARAANLVRRFELVADEFGGMFREYQGKAMPDDVYERFCRLRDERIPALRAELVEAITKTKPAPAVVDGKPLTYSSTQATNCASCGKHKHTPLRIDAMGGYVCLTCIDKKLGGLLGEFGCEDDPQRRDAERYRWLRGDDSHGFGAPRWSRWQVQVWGGNPLHWQNVAGEALDAEVDAAIASHVPVQGSGS